MSKAAERWPYNKDKCILIEEIFTRNELMDNPDLQLKLNVEIYEDAISATCPYGPIKVGCDIIHREQRKKSPKGMTGKAFRHLTPTMAYGAIKALMKSYLFWCAAETKTDLVQRLRRDLKWDLNDLIPLLQKLLNETLTRLSSDLRWEK